MHQSVYQRATSLVTRRCFIGCMYAARVSRQQSRKDGCLHRSALYSDFSVSQQTALDATDVTHLTTCRPTDHT